jgi:hypothetical protein
MHANYAYNVGMKDMQYTIRNIDPLVDKRLRALAERKKISMNRLLLAALAAYVGHDVSAAANRSLLLARCVR